MLCGLGGLYVEYARWRITPITVSQLAGTTTEYRNFRITDGYADFVSAVDSKDGTAVIPVRSHAAPNAPISLVIKLPFTKASALRTPQSDFDLAGEVYEADELPKGKLNFAPRVSVLSTEVSKPYGPKLASNLVFESLPILFGIIIICLNYGLGDRSIGSLFRKR